jgi:TetR/AcrR family transcriptional repressor of nem operon
MTRMRHYSVRRPDAATVRDRAGRVRDRGAQAGFHLYILDRLLHNVSTQEAQRFGMARPREFDEVSVLERAIECFRLRGYHATSVRDLADSMGLSGASLYNSFGGKRALFVKALDRYLDGTVRVRLKRLQDTLPPKQAIVALFNDIIEKSVNDRSRGGCLLINSALEIGPHDPALGAELAGHLGEIEDFFRRMIEGAQADGSVAADLNARDIGRLLLGVLVGLRVLARSRPEHALLEGMVRPALGLLN